MKHTHEKLPDEAARTLAEWSSKQRNRWDRRLRRSHPVPWALGGAAIASTVFVAAAFGGGRGGGPIFSSTKDLPWVWPVVFVGMYLFALGLAAFLNHRDRMGRQG
jgi:4-hydroxybenzoate polyprenyltransferase